MVDTLGLIIFLIGIAFLVLELAQPGFFLGVPGTVGIIVGGIQMIWPPLLNGSLITAFVLVPIVAGVSTYASIEFYKRFAPAVSPPETMSSDRLVGELGTVVVTIEPGTLKGKVKVGSIVWSATGDHAIPRGAAIRVIKAEGVHLIVEHDPAKRAKHAE